MDEELLSEFLTESNENLATIEEQLLDLEADPGNAGILDGIFRVIHTVKGSCGFIGLSRLEKVAHAGENLLGKVRSLKYEVDGDIISLLLESTDAIKELLAGIEENGSEPDLDHSSICTRLAAAERLIDGGGDSAAEAATDEVESEISLDWLTDMDEEIVGALKEASAVTPAVVLELGFEKLRAIPGLKPASALKVLGLASAAAKSETTSDEPAEKKKPVAKKAKEDVIEGKVVAESVDASEQKGSSKKPVTKDEANSESLPSVKPKENLPAQKAPAKKPKVEGSIRVDVSLLDELMNQVGELVLSRNRLLRLVEDETSVELVRTSRGISQITSRLQDKLLHTRMQPISTNWSTVPRLLRDICKQLGKKIRVDMQGQETELDRTILAAMKDPMTHIIRNSCDHGVESPEVRRERNKPEEGFISLKARQESGFIVIEIGDDGGGIDPARIKDKALRMDLITDEQYETMSDKAALQLIFHAGLSTVEKVSNLSGRGVGMDVVRTQIEKVGGTVEIDSQVGVGTTLLIRIPLTLAIIPAMIVECDKQRFAVPQMLVQELISIDSDSQNLEMLAGKPFYRLRGELLPMIGLDEVLKLREESEALSSVVVVNIGDRQYGIGVDKVLGAEEIVVKPLGKNFQHLDVYGGCSILGDGLVVPILDCNGLTRELRQSQEASPVSTGDDSTELATAQESQHILVFGVGEERFAIPMALVERIENLKCEEIEKSGDREVLQYRGEIIPVVRLSNVLGIKAAEAGATEKCLIISDQGRRISIQVDKIIDIVQQKLDIQLETGNAFYLGTAVIEGKSTEIIDIFEIIKTVAPNWFNDKRETGPSQSKHVLFVEDTIFFRNLVVPVLESMGFDVSTARNGVEAKNILEKLTPDLLLTDLEMPEMDGFELAEWVRTQPRLKEIPIVALSSLDPDEYKQRAESLGFTDRITKFDRKVLIEHLSKLLGKNSSTVDIVDAEVIATETTGG